MRGFQAAGAWILPRMPRRASLSGGGGGNMIDLSVELAGIASANPVLPASGTYEIDDVHEGFFSPAQLGAVINKTVFMDARPGNPPPRIAQLDRYPLGGTCPFFGKPAAQAAKPGAAGDREHCGQLVERMAGVGLGDRRLRSCGYDRAGPVLSESGKRVHLGRRTYGISAKWP